MISRRDRNQNMKRKGNKLIILWTKPNKIEPYDGLQNTNKIEPYNDVQAK